MQYFVGGRNSSVISAWTISVGIKNCRGFDFPLIPKNRTRLNFPVCAPRTFPAVLTNNKLRKHQDLRGLSCPSLNTVTNGL